MVVQLSVRELVAQAMDIDIDSHRLPAFHSCFKASIYAFLEQHITVKSWLNDCHALIFNPRAMVIWIAIYYEVALMWKTNKTLFH